MNIWLASASRLSSTKMPRAVLSSSGIYRKKQHINLKTKQKIMAKLWQTKVSSNNLAEQAEQFTVGDDYLLDQRLISFDVQASKAHARGLHKIGLLDDTE